jgi:hypothetical protein
MCVHVAVFLRAGGQNTLYVQPLPWSLRWLYAACSGVLLTRQLDGGAASGLVQLRKDFFKKALFSREVLHGFATCYTALHAGVGCLCMFFC